MDDIFSAVQIGGINLNNRILRSATDESMADESGFPTQKLYKTYERLAKGEVGAIITGFMAVSEDGQTKQKGMCRIDTDASVSPLTDLVTYIHSTGVPIICQIAHCGRHGRGGHTFNVNRLSELEIKQIIIAFVDAAVRAKTAGFDGVELHCAHSYLLAEFLSPRTNHRKDSYGGSIEGRFRIVREILEGIRKVMPDYPLWIKMNGTEYGKGGLELSESVKLAKLMEKEGCDTIEISRGGPGLGPESGQVPLDIVFQDMPGVKCLPAFVKRIVGPVVAKTMQSPEPLFCYNLEAAVAMKKAVAIPVVLVGGIHDLEHISSAIGKYGIDAVAMSRPLILEPTLISKYKNGTSSVSKCINCNYCSIGIMARPIRCYYGKIQSKQ